MDKYLLENWQESEEGQRNYDAQDDMWCCPECGYPLDLIEDKYGRDYVFCWHYCLYSEDQFCFWEDYIG